MEERCDMWRWRPTDDVRRMNCARTQELADASRDSARVVFFERTHFAWYIQKWIPQRGEADEGVNRVNAY